VWRDPKLNKPFVDSLAVAGVNGTLEDRFEKGPARGHVRAKTGTTDIASSLAGFVRDRFAFVVLMNASPIPFSKAHRAQDRFVQLLAKQ
jgi:D-alanyl-D-alanine carboxypeptidase/D-alanyl-D-alanine-endopeptidase (penicillin-binding protein 4)